jgi:hypothetical protein
LAFRSIVWTEKFSALSIDRMMTWPRRRTPWLAGGSGVLVHEDEGVYRDVLVEGVDLGAAREAVPEVIHKTITVAIHQVVGDDRQVADADFVVPRIVPVVGVGIEDDERVRL